MIKLEGRFFKDEAGRTLILRGVNLGGSSKVPFTPNGATWNRDGFYDHRAVSFVGRPFPIDEADEHFRRLRAWGFTFLRFLITWEAIEHSAPGVYDGKYLDYLEQVVEKAAEYGITLFIDPHQDVWSRFSGGDGAPGWTFEAVGMDMCKLHTAGAAILHQEYGDPFPRMVWPTNYNKLAAATMFTLFFGGNDFAPQTVIEGTPVQEYLQSHYIDAIKQVAMRLKDHPNVIGYDTLNEPSPGFIGTHDLLAPAIATPLRKGDTPTVFQSFLLGSGFPQEVDVYDFGLSGIRKTGKRLINAERASVWLPGHTDIWMQNGVWDLDSANEPHILRPEHFSNVNGNPVDFHRDYLKPFANRFAREIRVIDPDALIFVEGVPEDNKLTWGADDAANVVHAAHWYDVLTLLTKTFRNWLNLNTSNGQLLIGAKRVRRYITGEIRKVLRQSDDQMMHAPTLIGEVGIPFDMQGKRAYRTGDFSMQVRAMDATMTGLERNFANFTLWNYTADNTNAHGDQWNDEDLSIFSRDQMTGSNTIHDGGRALKAVVRPYPRKISGEPISMSFDIQKTIFEFTFRHDSNAQAPTEIFLPDYQYPDGCHVVVSDGTFEMDRANQTLIYHYTAEKHTHTILVKIKNA
jgi:hypothetical protein